MSNIKLVVGREYAIYHRNGSIFTIGIYNGPKKQKFENKYSYSYFTDIYINLKYKICDNFYVYRDKIETIIRRKNVEQANNIVELLFNQNKIPHVLAKKVVEYNEIV